MAILDKVKFWQKKENYGLNLPPPAPLSDDSGLPQGAPPDTLGASSPGMDAGSLDPLGSQGMPPPLGGQIPSTNNSFQQDSFQQPQFREQPIQAVQQQNKDFEIIIAKLDALKATLDALNQRVGNLERIASSEHETREYRPRSNW